MADVEMKEPGGGRHQGTKSKKLSTRIDMTPMVDVAFLLITFFMLTTTLQKPKTMNLYLPEDVKNPEEQNKVKESQALTIILGKNHQVITIMVRGRNLMKGCIRQLSPTKVVFAM